MFAKWKIYFKSKMKKEEWGITNVLLWTAVLNEFDITEAELIAGTTKACFAKELKGWPPTTATDFIQVIRGNLDDSSYPDMRKAYDHAVDYAGRLFDDRTDWQHVVIYETAQRVGLTKLATQREKMTWFDWQQVYPKVCDEHKAGAIFILPIDKSKQIENKHTPVQAGSDADKKISEQLAQLRRVAV
jgi:hypothetical protein